jgi:hypothetical protein
VLITGTLKCAQAFFHVHHHDHHRYHHYCSSHYR